MSADDLAQDFINGQKHHFKDDPHLGPDQYATEYIDAETGFVDSQSVLLGAKVILVHEIAKEPSIRKEIRKAFESFGVVTVKPTDKGNLKIDEMHPYFVSGLSDAKAQHSPIHTIFPLHRPSSTSSTSLWMHSRTLHSSFRSWPPRTRGL